jgi:multidrug efflux pump subunit AcrB
LLLVFGLLWLFLDFRLSFWAGMGMPISIAGALAIMWGLGATINMISLFGLIMVLGIIVDDAIVVGEAIYVHRKNGEPPLKAAIEGVTEVGMPVVAAVTTTIVAFVPLLFVEGLMGKFIAIMPIVVIACLVISLVECLILLPAHLSHLPDPNQKVTAGHPIRRIGQRLHQTTSHGLEWFVDHVYEPFLGDRVLQYRYVTLACAIAVLILTFGFMQSGLLKFEFFPNLDGNQLTATVEFPEGTPLKVTQDAIARMEEGLRRVADQSPTLTGDPMIENMFSLVGSTIADDRPRYGNHLGSVRVEMLDTELRGVHTDDLMAAWEKEIGPLPGVESLSFSGMEAGPPGAAIEIWLQGNHMENLLAAAEELKQKLATYEGVYQIAHDFRPGKNEMRFALKDEARALGITVADLARQVYAGYFGEEALRIQRGRDDIRIRVRYTEAERKQIDELSQVRIRTPQGQEVPLMSVADVEYGPGLSNVNRTDGMRRVAVTAEVNPAKANANEIFEELSTGYFENLQRKYPGMMVSLQGEKKNMRESFGSLAVSYPLALLGIFIIIATMFRSYVQPFIIMVTVPFGIIGAVLGHMLLGYDLTIMSFFGMVALSGVVVNDAIVLIERINEFMAEGRGFRESVRLGGARRFRAVFLTTITTVGGLAPLIIEKDMQAQFLVPMAISIAAGVAFATLLTLVLIPCLLVILNDLRRVTRWMFTHEWPTAEEVEPSRMRYVDLTKYQPGEEVPVPEVG